MPKANIDLTKWSVVACDQYTSDHDYWNGVEKTVGASPSTLRLTLPEIYLENPDIKDRIHKIHLAMQDYSRQGLLQSLGECIMYVERSTAASGLRQGLIFAMDLERYSYAPDSKSLIRATEGTIVERIPPRLQVRQTASLELPHIMILINDPSKTIIEGLAQKKSQFKPAYNVNLMAHGGTVQGFQINQEDQVKAILQALESLLTTTIHEQNSQEPLLFAMGDGNHSLATAKASWENIKRQTLEKTGSIDSLADHPARYALAEIVNVHSPGLRFEPIHRAVFTAKVSEFTAYLQKCPAVEKLSAISEAQAQDFLLSPSGQEGAVYYDGSAYQRIDFKPSGGKLPTALVDAIFADFKTIDSQAKIDFIHGWQDNKKLTSQGAVNFFLPVIARERLFAQVQAHGPLPRKAFSMGDAEEKRYYMEARRIER